jgi:eukaryotic-like serine/threonine-protein kinase
MHEHVTLLHRERRDSTPHGVSSGFPTDLLGEAAGRLRVLALLYVFIFFMAGFFPMFLDPADRVRLFGSFRAWGPGTIGISVGLLVAALIRSRRLSARGAMNVGLAFEIVSSYAIAAAEFGDPAAALEGHQGFVGLSWVAVWVLLFTVAVPTSPRRAVLAAMGSVSAVPVVIGSIIASGITTFRLTPLQFFFGLVFPYLLVVGMAYVGARVIYKLGTEIRRARELGSYRLEEKLGQGGMGEVWRARHRMLARPAAIKLIRSSLTGDGGASEEAIRRFEREAQTIARLRSPHTVELFDFGRADDGSFYYVMELLEGLDADSLVRRFGPVPPERAIFLLRQVCHSLSEAHASGLVHRDVKPANVVLCRYGEEDDFVKVLDFGIVRAVHDPGDSDPLVTRENEVRGTPAYMAPEQVTGAGLDGRADIYAVGCLAYWLVTGQPVFTAETPMGILVHHVQTPPTPPSARAEQAIPPAFDDLVLACLAKDPARRPQTARELSARLAGLDGAGAWTQDRARGWWEMHHPIPADSPGLRS